MNNRTWQKHNTQPPAEAMEFDPSTDITDQDSKEEADINNIMAAYLRGEPLPANVRMATYGDFYDAPDFHQAQVILTTAQEQFNALPSSVRTRFDNDPARFLAFVHDRSNLEEARKLGLLTEVQKEAAPPPPTTTTDKAPETKP